MFGQFCYRRDDELREGGEDSQSAYASELLADLLNRAAVLEPAMQRALEQRDAARRRSVHPRLDIDYVGALEELATAFGLFLGDLQEAAVRARRARLIQATVAFTDEFAPGEEDDASLAPLGGAFIGRDGSPTRAGAA